MSSRRSSRCWRSTRATCCPQHFAIVSPLAALLWAALAAATLVSYAALLRLDPGNLAFTAAERAAAADGYWAAVEARVWGDPLQRAFCHRTEGPRPPRSKFSPLAGALVACHDHDCVWVHRAIGAGNHRTFVAFLAAGAATIALSLGTLAHALAAGALGELIPEAAASPILFRVALWAVADALLLLLFLGYLLRHQVLCISRNSTVVEMMRGFQGSAYDRGSIVANRAAFARADRCGEAEAAKAGTLRYRIFSVAHKLSPHTRAHAAWRQHAVVGARSASLLREPAVPDPHHPSSSAPSCCATSAADFPRTLAPRRTAVSSGRRRSPRRAASAPLASANSSRAAR